MDIQETQSELAPSNRRLDDRYDVTRSVKIFEPYSYRYRPAQTMNLSRSGALLELGSPTRLHPGDTLQLVIDTQPSQAIVNREDFLSAVVQRMDTKADGSVSMAVRFRQRQSQLMVA